MDEMPKSWHRIHDEAVQAQGHGRAQQQRNEARGMQTEETRISHRDWRDLVRLSNKQGGS